MTAWQLFAACAGTDPELFHSPDADDRARALGICAGCPVLDRCRDEAVAEGETWAVRGGRDFAEVPMVVAEQATLRVTIAACPGSRARYVAGCRCLKCTEQNRLYKANYDKNGPVTRREKVVDMNVSMFEGVSA